MQVHIDIHKFAKVNEVDIPGYTLVYPDILRYMRPGM